jgi:hypothetical protein
MDKALQIQAFGVVCLIASSYLLVRAPYWAHMHASNQRSFFGLVQSEEYIRAGYRFVSLFALLCGLMCFAIVYLVSAVPFIGTAIFVSGLLFLAYCFFRFSFRSK